MGRLATSVLCVLVGCGSYSGGAEPRSDAGSDAPNGRCIENVIHVSASRGDDLNDGCDPAKPKKTLASALGQAQAKNAGGTEIRTCVESFRERVVMAYPASIIGGFDCATWAPGGPKDKTTIEAPADAVEAFIAFGAPVDASARLERLRFVGPSRGEGVVSALRFKEGASPVVRSFEVAGGSTSEGIAIAVAIEAASPTLEDGVVEGGSARCTTGCSGTIASGVTIREGNARLRRLRITGGTVEVVPRGAYVGSIALDVVGPSKAVDADAFSELEIVHGVARVADQQPAWGMRVSNAQIDLVDSKILPGADTATCIANPCGGFAISAAASATMRVRRSRIIAPNVAGAPGTANVTPLPYALSSSVGATLEVSSSFVSSPLTLMASAPASLLSVLGSTLVGGQLVVNNGGTIEVKSSVVGLTSYASTAVFVSACEHPSKTTFDSSAIIGAPPIFAELLVVDAGTCTGTGPSATLEAALAKSDARNTIAATSTITRTSCGEPAACLAQVFASTAPLDGFALKEGAPCGITQGGVALPGASDDASKKMRTPPFSMGALEYDGACSP